MERLRPLVAVALGEPPAPMKFPSAAQAKVELRWPASVQSAQWRCCRYLLRRLLRLGLLSPLALILQRLAHLLELLQRRLVGARKMQIEVFERTDDGGTYH